MADAAQMAFIFAYVGSLIANPPAIDGKILTPAPDASGNISYTFTHSQQPCDGPQCQQEIFHFDKNPESCWAFDNIELENVEHAPGFNFVPNSKSGLKLLSLGDVSGRVFTFRAHVVQRCR